MKILVTGFDPFGGEKVNPAFEAVKLLPDTIAGMEIIKKTLPVVFGESGEVLEGAIIEHNPDVVLSIGQAGGRFDICVEKVGINLMDGRIPDNAGYQPIDAPIKEDGATAYFSTLPVKAMVAKSREWGVPATLSFTAGTYVCNYIMYVGLYLAATKYPHIKAGFIHVPFAPEQGIGKPQNTPTMSVENIAKSIEAAIVAIAENEKDITAAMGTTH